MDKKIEELKRQIEQNCETIADLDLQNVLITEEIRELQNI